LNLLFVLYRWFYVGRNQCFTHLQVSTLEKTSQHLHFLGGSFLQLVLQFFCFPLMITDTKLGYDIALYVGQFLIKFRVFLSNFNLLLSSDIVHWIAWTFLVAAGLLQRWSWTFPMSLTFFGVTTVCYPWNDCSIDWSIDKFIPQYLILVVNPHLFWFQFALGILLLIFEM